jgi:hypothetical protein
VTTRGACVGEGNGSVAKSSSVIVTLVIAVQHPPASDMIKAACPPGPTSIISKSDGKPWVMFLNLTFTFVIEPDTPVTAIFEGYGAAGAGVPPTERSLTVIVAKFVKVIPSQGVGVGVGVKVAVGVGV